MEIIYVVTGVLVVVLLAGVIYGQPRAETQEKILEELRLIRQVLEEAPRSAWPGRTLTTAARI